MGLSPQWFVSLGYPGHRVQPCIQLVWCCWSQESSDNMYIDKYKYNNAISILYLGFLCAWWIIGLQFISLVKARKVCIILTYLFEYFPFCKFWGGKFKKKKLLPIYFYAMEGSIFKTANKFLFQERKRLKEFATGTPCSFMELFLMVLVIFFCLP